MSSSKTTSAFIQKVIKKHGPVLDLRKNPEILIDILRGFEIDAQAPPHDAGTPLPGIPDGPGGTPEPPPGPTPPGPTPPAPSMAHLDVTNQEILRALLALSREVSGIKKTLKDFTKARSAAAGAATDRPLTARGSKSPRSR